MQAYSLFLQVKQAGFTLIELVIVIVLLGVLSAVVIPRFINVADSAHETNIKSMATAFSSAVNVAHVKWLAQGKPTTSPKIDGLDFLNKHTSNVGFNNFGWPNAANTGESDLQKTDVLGFGGNNAVICRQIMINLLAPANLSIGDMRNCDYEYCAEFNQDKCIYQYQKNQDINRKIIYDPQTGNVSHKIN